MMEFYVSGQSLKADSIDTLADTLHKKVRSADGRSIHNTPGRGNTLRDHKRDIPCGERLHLCERDTDTDGKGYKR